MPPLDQIVERVELLLARHAELQRSNALLSGQVAALSLERDSLRSRLSAARARIDALVDRLAQNGPAPETAPAPGPSSSSSFPSSSPLPLKDSP